MLITTIIGCLVAIYTIQKIKIKEISPSMARKAKILKYRTIGILLWPIIFYSVVPIEDRENIKMLLAFVWPFMVWIWDSYLLTYGLVSEHSTSKIASSRIDPTTISSMSFALFGLLGGSSTGQYSYIFLYAILSCIAFVFPNHNLASGSPEDLFVEAFQKTVLSWALGMLFVGVTLQHTITKNKNEND